MIIINLLTSFIYLILFIISFKSFFIKKDFRFYVSLNISFSFFLWFVISIIKLFNISEIVYYSLIPLDFYALFLLFHSVTKIKSILTEQPILIRRKILNIFYLLLASITTFYIGYNLFSSNIILIILTKNIINFLLTILIFIHLPSFKEYKYLKIGIFIISFKYLIAIIGFFFNLTIINYLIIFLPIIALPIFLYYIYNIYSKSNNKKAH